MAIRTYTVGDKSGVRRLDNLTGPWVDVPLNIAPLGAPISVILRDVMTDPIDSNKVFAVGGRDKGQGALGIYVSTDGGAVWVQPGGDLASPSFDFPTFWEVWVVDSNTIYASGSDGYIFKSLDGGLTFNKTVTSPTPTTAPTQFYDCLSIHFITPLIGISTSFNSIYKTVDGGISWVELSGGPILTSGASNGFVGLHLSLDNLTIVGLGKRLLYVSTDGGATFTAPLLFGSGSPGLHLTWIDDNTLWVLNKQENRYKSIDGGSSWLEINPVTFAGQANKAGHVYDSFGQNGFFSNTADILSSADSLLSGAFSETSPYGIEAVWTIDENPPEPPCGCPEGTTYDPPTGLCNGLETIDATLSGTLYEVIAGDQAVSYGWAGANFYENIDSKLYPIGTSTGQMEDFTNTPLLIQQNIISTLWGDPPTANALTTLLNEHGVWGLGNPSQEWIGFTACVEVPETKVYYIALAADNQARFKIDSELIVEFEGCNNFFNFNYWHVFPVTLTAGTRIIELEAKNCSSAASFAAEIYDATLSQLTAMTLPAQLTAVTLFSTLDKIGDDFDTGQTSGYQCPEGWALSICNGSYQCARAIEVAFTPCNCYEAFNCEDPSITMLVTTEDLLDINLVYKFEGADTCWTILPSTACPFDNPITAVTESFVDCQYCLGQCYILTDCEGNEDPINVNNELSAFVGMVIQISSCPDICWIVSEAPDCEGTVITVNMTANFADCVTCLPSLEPEPPLTLKPRAIQPKWEPAACDTEYVEDISCKFAEALYQKVVSDRYGLEFCCSIDLQKYAIRFRLMQLKAMFDPNACIDTPIDCCAPCDVQVLIELFETRTCPPPEGVGAIIEIV